MCVENLNEDIFEIQKMTFTRILTPKIFILSEKKKTKKKTDSNSDAWIIVCRVENKYFLEFCLTFIKFYSTRIITIFAKSMEYCKKKDMLV